MVHVPFYLDIPLFIFVILAFLTIYKLIKVKSYLSEGKLKESYVWLVVVAISFSLWGVDHLYHDLVPLGDLEVFFHYVVSHGFLMISIVALYISASKLGKAHKDLLGKIGISTKAKRKR